MTSETNLTFHPSETSGRQARANIEKRLAESLAHIFEQCRAAFSFDEERAEAVLALLNGPDKVEPALFGSYFELVRAIDGTELEPVKSALDRLLSNASAIHPTEIRIRPFCRAEFSEEEERAFRDQFISESLSNEQVAHLSPADAQRISARLANALSLLQTSAPRTFAEFRRTIAEIVPARGAVSSDGLVFDGSSSLERWGAILINADRADTDVKLCEMLAHESAHNTLFGTSPVNFHVTNSPDERYPSPLRYDPRPIEGIYHASFVLARMCFAMREIADAATLPDEMRTEARERAKSSIGLFRDGYSVLEKHARYTEEGRAIIEAARDYMSSVPAA